MATSTTKHYQCGASAGGGADVEAMAMGMQTASTDNSWRPEYEALLMRAAAMLRALDRERARLQRILDSRPAINAGLPETYIEWTRGVYETDFVAAKGADS